MVKSVTVTEEAMAKLARDLKTVEAEIAAKMERRADLQKRLNAMRILLGAPGNGGAAQSPTNQQHQFVVGNVTVPGVTWNFGPSPVVTAPDASTASISLPAAILEVLAKHPSPMGPGEIRDRLVAAGVPVERLGATLSYLYTALARLRAKKQIEKVRGGKYRLPQSMTAPSKPEGEDVAPTAGH